MDRRRDGMTRIQRHGSHAGGSAVITEGTVLRSRRDGIDGTRREVVAQTVKQISTRGIRRDRSQGLPIRGEDDLYACHSGIIRHLDHTGYLSEGRTPAFGGLVIRRSIAITGIVRRDGILVVLIGHGGLVEEIVILSGIDDLGSLGGAFDHTLDHKRIDCRRVDSPLELYTGLELVARIALRSGEGTDLCRLLGIEFGAFNGNRLQIDRVGYAQGRMRLVNENLIAVVGTGGVCDIRHVSHPTTVRKTNDAVLGNRQINNLSCFYHRATQDETSRAIPDTTAVVSVHST